MKFIEKSRLICALICLNILIELPSFAIRWAAGWESVVLGAEGWAPLAVLEAIYE
jgi:hypothetical protein